MSLMLMTQNGHIALAQGIYNNYLAGQLYLGWGTLPAFLGSPTNLSATASTTAPSSLTASTFYYNVTALTANGETTPSTTASVSLSSNGYCVILSWAAIQGATGYNVYGRAAGTGQVLLASNVSNSTWTDTGSGIIANTNPPTVDTTSLTSWTNTPTTPNIAQATLLSEVGRRKVSLAQYVLPSPTGSLTTASGTWAVSATPTRYLYCYTSFALSDASSATIYQYGFFVNTIATATNVGANYLTPGQVSSPGTLLCLENVTPIYRDGSSMETHQTVMTF